MIYNIDAFGRAIGAKENSLKEDYIYEYDVNGYLMKTKVNYAGFSTLNSLTTYTYNLNNLARTLKTDYFRSSTEDYEYYLNTRNTIGDENKGMNIFGRQSMNLVKTYTSNVPGASGINVIDNVYEFDSNKRVVKKISTLNTQQSWQTIYTYND